MLSGAQSCSGTGRPDLRSRGLLKPQTSICFQLDGWVRAWDKALSEQVIAERRRLCGSIDLLCRLPFNARTGIQLAACAAAIGAGG